MVYRTCRMIGSKKKKKKKKKPNCIHWSFSKHCKVIDHLQDQDKFPSNIWTFTRTLFNPAHFPFYRQNVLKRIFSFSILFYYLYRMVQVIKLFRKKKTSTITKFLFMYLKTFADCSCLTLPNTNHSNTAQTATLGKCPIDCNLAPLFLVSMVIIMVFHFMADLPGVAAVLRWDSTHLQVFSSCTMPHTWNEYIHIALTIHDLKMRLSQDVHLVLVNFPYIKPRPDI